MNHDDAKGPGNGFIDGLLYFTAGPDGEMHGLFGFLRPQHPNVPQAR